MLILGGHDQAVRRVAVLSGGSCFAGAAHRFPPSQQMADDAACGFLHSYAISFSSSSHPPRFLYDLHCAVKEKMKTTLTRWLSRLLLSATRSTRATRELWRMHPEATFSGTPPAAAGSLVPVFLLADLSQRKPAAAGTKMTGMVAAAVE